MVSFVDLSVGFGFGVLGSVGIVCVTSVLRMFKGDVMEGLFKFMVTGFILITAVGYGDAILILAGQTVSSGIFGGVLMVSFALLLIGLIRLILWNENTKLSSIAPEQTA